MSPSLSQIWCDGGY